MGRAISFSTHARRAALPLVVLALSGYFAYHALVGDYGLLALQHMDREQAELETTLATLRVEREKLEHRVMLMRPESLDADLLDERARETLNLSHPDDVTIMRRRR